MGNGAKEMPPDIGRLMIVDDNVQDLAYHQGILRLQGHQVRAFASFQEAAACLEREDFDLVIVSQGSRAFEGRIVLRQAAESGKRPPIVVLTKQLDVECFLETVQLGASEYLEKPLAAAQVAQLVARYVNPSRRQA